MNFEKWQGLGNNYVIIESEEWALPLSASRAQAICDRNFGIGGDGILEVVLSGEHPEMIVWNPDGSHAENCGNGIRMVARYLDLTGRLPDDGVILTGGGPVAVEVLPDERVQVGMGKAVFPAGELREVLNVNGSQVDLTEVSMGNPHAIIEHASPAAAVESLGPDIEVAPRFPERTNVEFIRLDGPSELTMRVWERGVGETLACGTGACAAAVAAVRLSDLSPPVTVHLKGGDLEIDVDPDLEVTMTGPAAPIYAGALSSALATRLETL